ncbi:MAG: lytic transglycosylase domain-containing protein [Ignavibacteriota bacterium]
MLTSHTITALRLSTTAAIFSGVIFAQSTIGPVKPSATDRQAESVRRMERSVARQKAALKTQGAPTGGFFATAWVNPSTIVVPAPPECEAVDSEPVVAKAAGDQQVDPDVLRAVIKQESGSRPCAVSPAGAMGLMQLMPATAQRFHVADPFNMEQNVQAGAKYLKELLGRFHGDVKLALAAYNAGPERVDGDTPAVPDIPETQNYVMQILKSLEKESLERVK